MNFSQYFFGAGMPVVAMAQCQNNANRINRPNERFVSWLRILACRVILPRTAHASHSEAAPENRLP
jgi:hypothetical protein